jgi:rhomboid protease GluP
MPEKSEIIPVKGSNEATIQAIAFGAVEKMNWTIKHTSDGLMIVHTPRQWTKWDDEITIKTADNQLTITSKLVHGELWDSRGKNKKHIADFTVAFEAIRSGITEEQIYDWRDKVAKQKENTINETDKMLVEAAEIDKVMNFSTGNLYITYGIIGVNTAVFLLMVFSGVNFFSPSPLEVLKWGGNLPALTFGGEWWRLTTSVFLHFGIIHLAMNMYALYFIGSYLEPMLGKLRFVTAYLCTGLVASLLSILWHNHEIIVSAGASGAVFGMFGVFLSLLTTNIVPRQVKNSLMQSVLIFVAYNVFYGFKPNSGVDNAAHLGGLASGMVIGYVYYFTFKGSLSKKTSMIVSLLAAVIILLVFIVLTNQKAPGIKIDYQTGDFLKKEERMEKEVDREKFSRAMEHFSILEEMAIEAMQPSDTLSKEAYLTGLQKKALVDWTECINLMDDAAKLDLSDQLDSLRIDLTEYAKNRAKQTLLYIKANEEGSNRYNSGIDSLETEIEKITQKIKNDNHTDR